MKRFAPGEVLLSLPLFLRVRPLARGRHHRRAKDGQPYTPIEAQKPLINRLCELKEETIEGNFFLSVHFIFTSKKFPGDIDNLLKAVLDAMVKAQLIVDDRYCVGVHSTINYGDKNMAILEVERADEQEIYIEGLSEGS